MLNKAIQPTNDAYRRTLVSQPTIELIRFIVEESDKIALDVLIGTRALFRIGSGRILMLPEFLMELRDRIAPPQNEFDMNDCRIADCAYDLTLAKYSNLPVSNRPNSKADHYSLVGASVDCKNYYRAFLKAYQALKAQEKSRRPWEEEIEVGRLLQRLVLRNFLWSRKECERGRPFSIRYAWKVGGKTIYLWYPSQMTAEEFKAWLRENVTDVKPGAPDEKERIQSLIDKTLGRNCCVSLSEGGILRTLRGTDEICSLESQEGRGFAYNLAATVAQEKAQNWENLRSAIRALGNEHIKGLITRIFSDIENGEYLLTRLASQYGISKATLSRFAGSSWFEKTGRHQTVTVPDLWKNTAGVLAENPVFMDTVITSGFAGRLDEVLAIIEGKRREKE